MSWWRRVMVPDLPVRLPGASVPGVVRDAAARARRRPDPALLERVRDALARLPNNALGRHYFAIPGDRLACPRGREA
jgi:hypothetical protein